MLKYIVHLILKYNSLEEIKNIIEITTHKNEYKNLRSVVYPSLSKLLSNKAFQAEKIGQLNKVWTSLESDFNKVLEELKLGLKTEDIVCFVHTFGCEGWFNTDTNQIHVRTLESSVENTVDSIIHEIMHLATYKKDSTYRERENLVDKYMESARIRALIGKVTI
ncbi:MAG: hypothetical protein Q7T41_03950 [Candidatus Saccharibacteria bacterium]|nr:hypothetical protein [Candidatus Saccharibacteria bacterium]